MSERLLNMLGLMRKAGAIAIGEVNTKSEVSAHVGLNGCSMAAVTDIGFANAFIKALSQEYPGVYDECASEVEQRFSKAERRKKEAAAHERNKRNGKRRTNV